MPICPACKMEYIDGVTTCADCGAALVDELPPEPAAAQPDPAQPLSAPALLTEVADDVAADMAEALLGSHGIPVMRRYRGAGAYLKVYLGNARGVQLFVPDDMLAQAQELLSLEVPPGGASGEPPEDASGGTAGDPPGELDPAEEAALEEELEQYRRKQRICALVTAVIFIPPAIWGAVTALLYLFAG